MDLRELPFDSPGYRAALALRHRILRVPLGLEWTDEERAWEPRERHFGLLDGEELVACVSARPVDAERIKLRQMAVADERQGSGAGRELLESVEEVLREEGLAGIELNAREAALGFYEKLGYRKEGERFVEVGIPHWKVEKAL